MVNVLIDLHKYTMERITIYATYYVIIVFT